MKRSEFSLFVLRICVALVVGGQSLHLALNQRAIDAFASTGLPDILRQLLAWSEVIAALAFLFPKTLCVGGWALLVVFIAAVALHFAHGSYAVGNLVVDAAAVIVVLTHLSSDRPIEKPI